METFGDRLKRFRIEAKMSVADFALEIGVTPDCVMKLESGKRGRAFDRLPVIAKAVNRSIDDLFPEMDEESAEPTQTREESKTARACGFDENEDLKGWSE